jgi:hypothetical protein
MTTCVIRIQNLLTTRVIEFPEDVRGGKGGIGENIGGGISIDKR